MIMKHTFSLKVTQQNMALVRLSRTLRMSTEATREPWYKEGISFSCTMCGNCCSGSPGSVRFTKSEAEVMARKLEVSTAFFEEKYARVETDGESRWLELKEVPSPPRKYDDGLVVQAGLDCIFLDRKTVPGKALCGLYEARPFQCRSWPFWPEIVDTEDDWKEASQGAEGCPGLGKGSVKYTMEEIQEQVRLTEEYRDELDEAARKC
jgi:Fe-S-cluster containining protein